MDRIIGHRLAGAFSDNVPGFFLLQTAVLLDGSLFLRMAFGVYYWKNGAKIV